MKQGTTIISTDPSQPATEDVLEDVAIAETRAFTIGAEHHGDRLDRALAALVPEFSRNYLQQLVGAGAVMLNGATIGKPSQKVKAGDTGAIELKPTAQSQAFKPEAMVLDVVFEDEHLLVINKPAGLVVHPAPGNWSGTLLNGLLARDAHAAHLPRAGIVHRLDKDTSGLMVVARTRSAMDALVDMIAQRSVSRQYVALAHRPWGSVLTRRVDAPLGRDPRNRLRMAVVEGGKPAMTDFELLEDADAGCWVRATLHTGRTHQIRVHMAHIGHPLVADEVYGGAAIAAISRQALHAFRLAFVHPATGRAHEFRAPLPHDIRQALAQWGLRYNESDWHTSDASR
ncbi:RluA family pseudouridine synthase [Caenimonas koreensis]|uniref:RluA family pseudouridine synthase n=1 Tax=Caenimonas koreensis TaxID=367474 RepID=UPI0037840606